PRAPPPSPPPRRLWLRIDILGGLAGFRVRRLEGKLPPRRDLGADGLIDLLERRGVGQPLPDEGEAEQADRFPLADPCLLLLGGAVVGPVDVADVVSTEPVGVADEEA